MDRAHEQRMPAVGGRDRPRRTPRAGAIGWDAGGRLGVVALAAVALGNVLVWVLARPAGQPGGRYLGELCGVEAVLLFSCALVLATLLPGIERAFGGLDRVAIWHRRVAVAGLVLLVPHVALVTSPPDPFETSFGHALGDIALLGLLFLSLWALAPRLRAVRVPGLIRRLAGATYERWLTAHRLTGLFVIVAVAHGAIVDPTLRASALLRVVFIAIGAVGIAAYGYRELFARYVVPIYDYTVAQVVRSGETALEVALEPRRRPMRFTPGQFVVLAFGGPRGWQRHPFSVTSSPAQPTLEVAIKALGDYTREVHDTLQPGTPAKVAGPFGGFDYRQGGAQQIWIAAGIGVTPFASWIRSLDDGFERSVDFFYSVRERADALYLDEIEAAAERHPTLRPHLHCTDADGRLTPEAVMGDRDGEPPWIYMCGPPAMMKAFAREFRAMGVPRRLVRWEDFDVR
jgi:predicted ferric reductase